MKGSLTQIWHHWKEIATCIGDFQARLLLTLFYFSVLVPFGLVTSLFADPLQLNRRPTTSAWVTRNEQESNLAAARRLY